MQTLFRLLSPEYLFHRNLGPFTSVLAWYLLAGIVAIMAVAFVFRLKLAKNKDSLSRKTAQKFFNLTWTMGSLGLILWIFRQINAFYISAPILWLIWLLAGAVWLGVVLNYVFRIVPRRRQEIMRETGKKSYLP